MFAKVNHVVNLKVKKRKFQASILTKKGFHSLTFVLDQRSLIKVAKFPVGFMNDEFHKMYHTFMSLDGIVFSGRGRDFHTT